MVLEQRGRLEIATFGAGCFWGVEASFSRVEGVISTEVGFMGGKKKNPTYMEVCAGNTGHAEVVRILFDPVKVSYEDLLSIFWEIHDPTQLNRQGDDIGTQYRSVIFFHTPEQEKMAKASKERLEKSGKYAHPVVTEILPASEFYRAEEYHQHFYEKCGRSLCVVRYLDE